VVQLQVEAGKSSAVVLTEYRLSDQKYGQWQQQDARKKQNHQQREFFSQDCCDVRF